MSFQLGISVKCEITYFGDLLTITLVVKAKEPVKLFDPEEYKRLLDEDSSITKLKYMLMKKLFDNGHMDFERNKQLINEGKKFKECIDILSMEK